MRSYLDLFRAVSPDDDADGRSARGRYLSRKMGEIVRAGTAQGAAAAIHYWHFVNDAERLGFVRKARRLWANRRKR